MFIMIKKPSIVHIRPTLLLRKTDFKSTKKVIIPWSWILCGNAAQGRRKRNSTSHSVIIKDPEEEDDDVLLKDIIVPAQGYNCLMRSGF